MHQKFRNVKQVRSALLAAMLMTGVGCAETKDALFPELGAATVMAVRHAEASRAFGPDPDLTAEGHRRAEALADALEHAGVTTIYASQFKRTQQTVQPLADRLGLAVEVFPLDGGALEESLQALATKIRNDHPNGTVLIAGHSNTTPVIVGMLTGLSVAPLDESEFGDLFIILPAAGESLQPRLIRSRFEANDQPEE